MSRKSQELTIDIYPHANKCQKDTVNEICYHCDNPKCNKKICLCTSERISLFASLNSCCSFRCNSIVMHNINKYNNEIKIKIGAEINRNLSILTQQNTTIIELLAKLTKNIA